MIKLSLGAMSKPINKQLNEQGYHLTEHDEQKFEKIKFSITVLNVHSYISESVAHKARQKLVKEICNNLLINK